MERRSIAELGSEEFGRRLKWKSLTDVEILVVFLLLLLILLSFRIFLVMEDVLISLRVFRSKRELFEFWEEKGDSQSQFLEDRTGQVQIELQLNTICKRYLTLNEPQVYLMAPYWELPNRAVLNEITGLSKRDPFNSCSVAIPPRLHPQKRLSPPIQAAPLQFPNKTSMNQHRSCRNGPECELISSWRPPRLRRWHTLQHGVDGDPNIRLLQRGSCTYSHDWGWAANATSFIFVDLDPSRRIPCQISGSTEGTTIRGWIRIFGLGSWIAEK